MKKKIKKTEKSNEYLYTFGEATFLFLFSGLLLSLPLYFSTKKFNEEKNKYIIEEGNVLSKEVNTVEYEIGLNKRKYSALTINFYVDLNNDMVYDKEKDLLITSCINIDYALLNTKIYKDTLFSRDIKEGDTLIIERKPEEKNVNHGAIKAINNKKTAFNCFNQNNSKKLKELLEKSR